VLYLYILKRLVMTMIVVTLVMTALALLVHVVPGDPARVVLGHRSNPELEAIVRREMELDQPVQVQLLHFFSNAFHGDLGRDFFSRQPVVTLIGNALPHSVILAVTALLLAVLFGVPLGVFTATRPNSWIDRILGTLSISMITMPSYLAGLFLLLIFVVQFPLLPSIGTGTFDDPLNYAIHLILPATALALGWVGYLARLVRASMLEVLGADYIRSFHAFGVRDSIIFNKYALKNALIPTVAVLGVGLGNLMGGAVFIEVIFGRAGLGSLLFSAIAQRNFPIVRGAVLVVALLFIFANLIADLTYRLLDPRIRAERAGA
jgi:peptide/nickel transport system permease protein